MIKGYKFWAIIIAFFSIIVLVKYFDFSKKKDFVFKRNIADLPFVLQEKPINLSDGLSIQSSDRLLFTYKFSSKGIEINYRDFSNFSPTHRFVINHRGLPIYFTRKNVLLVDMFSLYNFDISGKRSKKIEVDNFKVFNAIPLDKQSNRFILLGERKISSSEYRTGFYLFDVPTAKIIPIKYIESTNDQSLALQNILRYSGDFSLSDGKILYTCDKYSKIYFFDTAGKILKVIQTKDNTPAPVIIHNDKQMYFYKRGKTHSTNSADFIFDNKVFVFSSRIDQNHKIALDVYSYKTGKYLRSYMISYKDKNAEDINSVIQSGNRVLICFKRNLLALKLSAT